MATRKQGPVIFTKCMAYTVATSGKETDIATLREANEVEAKCGCGINCCEAQIVIPDKVTGETTYGAV